MTGYDRDSPLHRIRLTPMGTRHDGRSDAPGPCPAPAVEIAGFPAFRYPSMKIGARGSRFRMGDVDRRFSRAPIPMHEERNEPSGDGFTGCERPNASP